MSIRVALFALIFAVVATIAGEADVETLVKETQAALRQGKHEHAIKLATQLVDGEPQNAQYLQFRADVYANARQHDKAVADCDAILKVQKDQPRALLTRGCAYFRAGKIDESLKDFDRLVEVAPKQEPYLWQRGLAQYYAGKFDEGRKQFEIHKTVNPNDVENAVWHYLCVARASGIEQAKKQLIPIERDGRVPMMQVFALFKGELKPEDVLAAAEKAKDDEDAIFFAHLYLGLYYEAAGDDKKAREHIDKAAGEFARDHYMGDVARVHAALMKKK